MLAAGGFALAYLMPQANTPEDAVRNLVTAINEEDVLGALDALAPSERDLLRDTLVDVTGELRRLDVLDDGADLNGVRGIDVEVNNLDLATTELGDGVSLVSVAGTATYRVDPSELPIGSFVKEQTDGDLPDPVSETETIEGLSLVAVEEDGRWYVSLLYSIADDARRDAELPVPAFGSGVEPEGAESPEAAVRAMVDAGRTLDARRAIALLPPDEAAALHDYAPLFLDDVEEAAAEARESSFTLDVKTLDLSVDREGDEASVKVDRMVVEATSDGDRLRVAFDGRCITYSSDDDEEQRTCNQPGGPLASSLLLPFTGLGMGTADDVEGADDEGSSAALGLAIVVVERGGEWYVSPIRTVLRPLVDGLRALDRQDLEELVEGFESMTTTDSISESGSAISSSVDDETARSQLRSALIAFKSAADDTGGWTDDPKLLAQVRSRGQFLLPYGGMLMPGAVSFDIDGTTLRLGTRGASGCFYLADDQSVVTYAQDAACGAPRDQQYSTTPWR